MFKIETKEEGLNILYGGWFPGGGGGGLLDGGIAVLEEALSLGGICFADPDEIPEEGIVLTASLVGSPALGKASIGPKHFERTYQLYKEYTGTEISAFISNEAGAQSITNGWIASALSGIPMLDAACDGRAHPTGIMGSMGLDKLPDYKTVQVAVGGDPDDYYELTVSGDIQETSSVVRAASTKAGGFISVLRNPVTLSYIKENSALGVVTMCKEIGAIIRCNLGNPDRIIALLSEKMEAKEIAFSEVADFDIRSEGGFDYGTVILSSGEIVDFKNEYMAVKKEGENLFTFPDLIAFLSADSGLPINSVDIKVGMKVHLLGIPRKNLLLPPCLLEID